MISNACVVRIGSIVTRCVAGDGISPSDRGLAPPVPRRYAGRMRRTGIAAVVTCLIASCGGDDGGEPLPCQGPGVSGRIVDDAGDAIAGARVTITDATGATSATRTDGSGRYSLSELVAGQVEVGASARDHAYVVRELTLDETCSTADLTLGPETEPGQWEDLGDPGEPLGGTNSAVLLPNGRVMMCHNTIDPVVYDPVSHEITRPSQSPRIQGCHAVTVLPDGRVLYVGGADQEVYGPGTTQVKSYDPGTDFWAFEPVLNAGR